MKITRHEGGRAGVNVHPWLGDRGDNLTPKKSQIVGDNVR